MAKNYWLVKSEPEAYSWTAFVKDGKTAWTGVRNFTARLNLRAMKKGDAVFFYHSNVGGFVVGDEAIDGFGDLHFSGAKARRHRKNLGNRRR